MPLYERNVINAVVAAAPRKKKALAAGFKRDVLRSLSPAQMGGIRDNLVKLDYTSQLHEAHPFAEIAEYQSLKDEIHVATGV
eukprot:2233862-Prymnesium_polylepis.1